MFAYWHLGLPAPLWLLALVACGCGQGEAPGTPDQAQALLHRLERLDPNAPPRKRLAALKELTAMPLPDPELAALRDSCASAHAGLLEVESLRAAAKTALAEAKTNAQARVPAGHRAATALSRAEMALKKARAALQRCRELTAPIARNVAEGPRR